MGRKRRFPRRLAATIAASAAIALVLAAPATSSAKGPRGFFGVSPAAIVGLDELDQMEQAGIKTLRFPFYWPILQPEARNGRPMAEAINFPRYDPLILEAAKRGIRILPYVYGTPSYIASDYRIPPIGSKSQRHEWALFLKALRDRYGPGGTLWQEHPKVKERPISAWQIWNEPSSSSFWKPASKSPEQYAKLLAISAKALRSGPGGDPTIVAAGLFGSPAHGLDLPTFLHRFYAVKGAKNSFDAIAIHPYAPGVIHGNVTVAIVRRWIQIARGEMREAGDSNKAMWITEIGWPTEGDPRNPFYVTQQQQAKLLKLTFSLFLSKRQDWHVRHVVWYTWRDNGVNTACDLCQFSGLFNKDLTPKPAWPAFVHFSGGTP